MLPLLYRYDTPKEAFEKSGLGYIKDCTKCVVTEERNGLYELELEILHTDRLARHIAVGMFVKVLANSKDAPQIFEIYSVSVSPEHITAKGQHIRYIAFGNVATETLVVPRVGTPVENWEYIEKFLDPNIENFFVFDSDITTTGVVTSGSDRPQKVGDLLSGSRGSMLDVFGGEFKYDNFKISLLSQRGTNTGVYVRYGANISSYQQDSDISTMYSYILPYAYVKAQNIDTKEQQKDFALYHDLIDLNNTNLAYKRALAYDFSEDFSDDILFSGATGGPRNYNELVEKLGNLATAYINRNEAELTDVTVNIKIDCETNLEDFKNCGLCDTVMVYFTPLSRAVPAKIVKTEYDALAERYIKLELGKMKKNLADLFTVKNIGGA